MPHPSVTRMILLIPLQLVFCFGNENNSVLLLVLVVNLILFLVLVTIMWNILVIVLVLKKVLVFVCNDLQSKVNYNESAYIAFTFSFMSTDVWNSTDVCVNVLKYVRVELSYPDM